MPLLERVRVEVYLPDLPSLEYQNLLRAFEEEITYAFGGCTIVRSLEGSYLYCVAPLALSTNFDGIANYVGELKRAAMEALSEAVLISVEQVYHASSYVGAVEQTLEADAVERSLLAIKSKR